MTIIGFSIFQIVVALVALAFIARGVSSFLQRKQSQTFFKALFSVVVWGGIFFAALFPDLAHIVSQRVGLGENLNTAIFLGFVVTFVALFKLLSLVERLERNVSDLVRHEALRKLHDKQDQPVNRGNDKS